MRTFSLHHDGFDRKYITHTPSGSGQLPVVMMLPGAGASAEWTLEETLWDVLAEREGFVIIVPEGLPRNPSKPSNFKTNPLRWNDGYPAIHSTVDDMTFLRKVLDEVFDRYSITDPQFFLTGFSNGAAMTFRFAERFASQLAGMAPVAGYCWAEQPKLARPIPTLYIVGEEDPLVPIQGGSIDTPWTEDVTRPPLEETWQRWRLALGTDVRFEIQIIEGLGHHWPGGRGLLSRRLFGPPSKRFMATEAIWDFFKSLHQNDIT